MYDYIKGLVISKQLNSYRGSYIIIEASCIGYIISAGRKTIERVETGKETKIYVSLAHKEDSMSLTGFVSKEERDIFNILQSVSGVGAKTALAVMEEFSAAELINIMIREDAKELSRAKGIGAKAAQKIIIELKDKLINWSNKTPVDIGSTEPQSIAKETALEVQNVLISLGYSADEVKAALKYVSKKDCVQTEELLKCSLEYLSSDAG